MSVSVQRGKALPSCSELRLDAVAGGCSPRRGCSSVLSPERPQLPASRAWALSITFITPRSLINGEESKDPKALIVINNRLVTAELIFHQGLLLASGRNGRERREEK